MSTHAPTPVRLPRPPGVLRRALAAHPWVVDVGIVVCYFFGCALMAVVDFLSGSVDGAMSGPNSAAGFPTHLMWPASIVTAIRMLVVAAALLFRRRFPLWGLLAVIVMLVGDTTAMSMPNGVALCFLLYAVPVYRSVRAGWVGYAVTMVMTAVSGLLPGSKDFISAGSPAEVVAAEGLTFGTFFGPLIATGVWLLAILLLGINIGNRRRYLEAIIDRAHQLARERDQLAQLAVAEERSRIAREMHDIVAHSVSVMIALSEGAARAATAAPEAAADAMQRSAETGRTALAEMRRLLGALHTSGDEAVELVPQPGVQDLGVLVSGFTDAGLRVSLRVDGEAAGDRGQELAVYRIVQEGLTNVLRYAGTGARADVSVALHPDRTVIEVRDYGRALGMESAVTGVGSGLGLAGLAERVRMFGGSITSGPVAAHEGTGWRVHAVLLVDAAAREAAAREAAAREVAVRDESSQRQNTMGDK